MKYADWSLNPRLDTSHFLLTTIQVGEKWQGRCHCDWKTPLFWNKSMANNQAISHVQYHRRWR